jgi:hypothetical protein
VVNVNHHGRRGREDFRIRKLIRKYDPATGKFTVDIRYKVKTDITSRTIGVAEAFGIGVDEYKEHVIYDNVEFKIGPADIVYITGDSGSGKSVLLRALEKDLGSEAANIDSVQADRDKPIVETVGETLDEALELLSRVGLNDAYCSSGVTASSATGNGTDTESHGSSKQTRNTGLWTSSAPHLTAKQQKSWHSTFKNKPDAQEKPS